MISILCVSTSRASSVIKQKCLYPKATIKINLFWNYFSCSPLHSITLLQYWRGQQSRSVLGHPISVQMADSCRQTQGEPGLTRMTHNDGWMQLSRVTETTCDHVTCYFKSNHNFSGKFGLSVPVDINHKNKIKIVPMLYLH